MSQIVTLGAGPAGMACSYTLANAKVHSLLIEKNDEPGGLCRTINFHGYLFDIGGHRFLSRSDEINQLWQDIMGEDLLHVRRLSRIYYNKRYFNYPISFFNTFRNLGIKECFHCIGSYFWCKNFRPGNDHTFEGWVVNRFGKRLYEIFFKTYTEKVWAVCCSDISANWAKQRIQGLSLKVAIKNALVKSRKRSPKTLVEEFRYPRTGPGEFYNRLRGRMLDKGVTFSFGKIATKIKYQQEKIVAVEVQDRNNSPEEIPVDYLFSSIPLPILIKNLYPTPPQSVLEAAQKLKFRSFVVVNVILDKAVIFPDQWIYVHYPEVLMGRIQNYKNWSSAMVPDSKKTSLGLEYFCTEGDDIWRMNDVDLIYYAIQELEKIGIVSRRHLIDSFVIRCPNVYPVYSLDYQENVTTIRNYLARFSNLQTFGRGGLFRYDNSDHALLTGIYAAKTFLGESGRDVWSVNTDREYLES